MARSKKQGTKSLQAFLAGSGRPLQIVVLTIGVAVLLLAVGRIHDCAVRSRLSRSDRLPFAPAVPPPASCLSETERTVPGDELSFFTTLLQPPQDELLIDEDKKKLMQQQRIRRRPAADSPVEAESASPAAAPGLPAVYTVQLGSFQNPQRAREFSEALAAKGYEPYILKVAVPGRGPVYRVRMGRFSSVEAAQQLANSIEQQERISVLITSR